MSNGNSNMEIPTDNYETLIAFFSNLGVFKAEDFVEFAQSLVAIFVKIDDSGEEKFFNRNLRGFLDVIGATPEAPVINEYISGFLFTFLIPYLQDEDFITFCNVSGQYLGEVDNVINVSRAHMIYVRGLDLRGEMDLNGQKFIDSLNIAG